MKCIFRHQVSLNFVIITPFSLNRFYCVVIYRFVSVLRLDCGLGVGSEESWWIFPEDPRVWVGVEGRLLTGIVSVEGKDGST